MQNINTEEQLLKICKELQIETDFNKRWEDGMSHHSESIRLVRALSSIDLVFNDLYFDWKTGGDGDNGETLMYQLDLIYELLDKGYSIAIDSSE